MSKTIKNFNLVEVIIAMGIIVVCLTTVMGLFSAGIKISKDASMKAYSNIMVEQMLGIYDTNPTIQDAIQNNVFDNATTLVDGVYETTSSDHDKIFRLGGSYDADAIKNAENDINNTITGDDTTINIYQSNTSDNLFKIDFQTSLTSSTVKDFSVIARMWIEPINTLDDGVRMSHNTADDSENLKYDEVLKIEISWPPQEPYANRLLQGNVLYFEKDL